MVITVGTGRERTDIANAIGLSIKAANPNYIKFLVTELSEKETLPLIIENIRSLDTTYEVFKSENENDIRILKEEYSIQIQRLLRKGINKEDITVDYTSGTKSMSAAVVMAAIENEIGTLDYIYGNRGKDGRVIPGTESKSSINPSSIYAKAFLNDGINAFNNKAFASAMEYLDKAKNYTYQDKEFSENLNCIHKLNSAYYKWDIFDIDGCFYILDKELSPDLGILSRLGVKKKVENNKAFLYKEKSNFFSEERAIDLYVNAMRRASERKYDDATARLYRLSEFLFQREVAKKGLYMNNDTDRIDISKLPDILRQKYQSKMRGNQLPLGLEGTIELLRDLKEESIEKVEQELKNLRDISPIRNKSILAHGFGHVTEDGYKRYLEFIGKLANVLIPEFEEKIQNLEFPKIRI
jgi:CRISPR-associated protein (TIGR02710 family)